MRSADDHFATLDLPRRRCAPREVAVQFQRVRAGVLRSLANPRDYAAARRALDAVHRAYHTLRDPARQAEHLRDLLREPDPSLALRARIPEPDSSLALRARITDDRYRHLRRYIESCLEGDLLRCSRRQAVLREARRLGFSDFHAHLMIAQVQFGDRELLRAIDPQRRPTPQRITRVAARCTAAGVLGLALFLSMIRWLGV